MADMHVPHFKNDLGIASIRVGTKEFMCDMGDDVETVCPYCSTLFKYDASLHGGAEPASCLYHPEDAAA